MRCNSPKLNIYYQAFKSSFYLKKSKVAHFLLKCKCWILYFNGHMIYDLPMTPKMKMSSTLHYGISKPKSRAKQHISRITGIVLIADYFFGGHFGNMQISLLNLQTLEWYLAYLKSTGKNTIETAEKSLTDTFIRLLRRYPCLGKSVTFPTVAMFTIDYCVLYVYTQHGCWCWSTVCDAGQH